jgi:preprotein translocase subunit SecA
MFTELMNNIWDEFARYVFNVEVEAQQEPAQGDGNGQGQRWGAAGNASSTGSRYSYAGGTAAEQPSALAAAAAGGAAMPSGVADAAQYAEESVLEPPPVIETKVLDEHERIGRNDPCWCGSGKKFKKCHGAA